MGQDAVLHPHDEHHRELQPLRLVEGYQGRRLHSLIQPVHIGDQSHPF